MEGGREVRVDRVKRLLEFFPRNQVELGNGLLRIRNRLQQVIPFPRQEREPLIALVELFEGHHVHRAHVFDALLHFAIVRFGQRQLFAAHERRLARNQIFRLRVHFAHARLAQVLPVTLILSALDFRMAPLLAQLLQRLAAHAQVVFHLGHPCPPPFPFLFQFLLPPPNPPLLPPPSVELPRQRFALRRQRFRFRRNRSLLLPQRHFAAFQLRSLFG